MGYTGTNIQIQGLSIEDSYPQFDSTYLTPNLQVSGLAVEDSTQQFDSTYLPDNLQIQGFSVEGDKALSPIVVRRRITY